MHNGIALHSLLETASFIRRNREKEARASGEHYNIFAALRLEYDEARLHSQFLADLLNPRGSHGQRGLFLKKFLEVVNLPRFDAASLAHAKVYTEEFLGPIAADGLSGGSIDIVIKIPHDHVIVLENKINAGDQPHQLIRYKQAYPKGYLLYLTKFGTRPSAKSTHFRGKEVVSFTQEPKHRCLSYKEHILEWLEACYGETTRQPLLRETLFQYIATVKKITNQSTDKSMSNEIADAIISSNAHLDGFFALRDKQIVKAVERKLLYKFIDEMEVVAQELGLEYTKEDINRENFGHDGNGSELVFHLPGTPFSLELGFDEWRLGFSIGVGAEHPLISEEDKALKQKVADHFTTLLGKDSDYNNYYLLHLKNAKHGDEYLHDWYEGSFRVWGAVNDGTLAKRVRWYFETFLKELKTLGCVGSKALPGKELESAFE